MKKTLLVMLVALLAAGCGGGGTTTSSLPGGGSGGGTGDGGGTSSGPVGYITVTFPGPAGPGTQVPVSAGGLTTIAGLRDHFRVVVKQVLVVPVEDEEGNITNVETELQRKIDDAPIPGTVQIPVAPGDGYTVELLTYNEVGAIKNMLEYGKSDPFPIVSGPNSVTVSLSPVATYITMTPPATVYSGMGFNVLVSKTVPLRPQYYLSQFASTETDWTAISDFVVGYPATPRLTVTAGLTAPPITVPPEMILYFQGQFFIDDSLLKTEERTPATPPTWSNWRINCPDPAYTDAYVSALLLPGTVEIIISNP